MKTFKELVEGLDLVKREKILKRIKNNKKGMQWRHGKQWKAQTGIQATQQASEKYK